MWKACWHNFVPEVVKQLSFPPNILLHDLTLEGNGEEAPGTVFTHDEKVTIAKKLDEIRVHRIDAGWLSPSSPEDVEVVREIAQMGLGARVTAYVGLDRSNVDLALKCDLWGVWTAAWATEPLMRKDLNCSEK